MIDQKQTTRPLFGAAFRSELTSLLARGVEINPYGDLTLNQWKSLCEGKPVSVNLEEEYLKLLIKREANISDKPITRGFTPDMKQVMKIMLDTSQERNAAYVGIEDMLEAIKQVETQNENNA